MMNKICGAMAELALVLTVPVTSLHWSEKRISFLQESDRG